MYEVGVLRGQQHIYYTAKTDPSTPLPPLGQKLPSNTVIVRGKQKAGADPGFSKGGGTNECQRRKVFRGVLGHDPPEIFENLSL